MEPENHTGEPVKRKRHWLIRTLANKYILVSVVFVMWMLFFDRHNYFYLSGLRNEAIQARHDLEYYRKEIDESRRRLEELASDKDQLEKFGRETYFMKRNNEDVYVIVPEKGQ